MNKYLHIEVGGEDREESVSGSYKEVRKEACMIFGTIDENGLF